MFGFKYLKGLVSCLVWLGYGGLSYGSSYQIHVVNGSSHCCHKNFDPCELNCASQRVQPHSAKNSTCLKKCIKVHCRSKLEACQGSSQVNHRLQRKIRNDGRITGPGVVVFNVGNLQTDQKSLTVVGGIRGTRSRGEKILRESESVLILPGDHSIFRMYVTEQDYRDWSRLYKKISVGLSLAREKEPLRWRYKSLLTQKEVKRQPAGQFLVKGAFSFR